MHGHILPPAARQARLQEQYSDTFINRAIHAFCNAQLLRGVADRVFASNASIPKKGIESSADILTTLIILKYTNSVTHQILCPGLIIAKRVKNTGLLADEVDRRKTRKIVDKRDPIKMAMAAMHG